MTHVGVMPLRHTILTFTAWACLAVMLGGCAAHTRQRLLAFFFDGTQAPPPTRRLRRDLLREIEELKRALDEAKVTAEANRTGPPSTEPSSSNTSPLPIEQAKTWKDAAALLPHDKSGQVDWVKALKSEVMAPRTAPNPHAPVQAVFDLDVALATSHNTWAGATFSHAAHTEWLACQSCHPEPFPLSRRVEPPVITMAKIRQGRLCGMCHGTVAFGVNGACSRCHTVNSTQANWHPREQPARLIEQVHRWDEAQRMLPVASDGMPDWTAALVRGVIAPHPAIDPKAVDEPILASDVVRIPAGLEDYEVVFPHAAHTAWMHCESCHPDPFPMKAGATPMSMDRVNAGELCGRCHGTVAFPVTSCARCHPGMEGGS